MLDLGLPKMDGLEVCRRLRQEGSTVPVLVLTARADEVDTVVGLDAGADDYVTKPFRLAELLARARALLRRGVVEPPAPEALVRIDPEGRRVFLHGQEVQLTGKEFELLKVLVANEGKVVSREKLMRDVWDSAWYGSTKTLDMHISVLRRKLGDDASHPQLHHHHPWGRLPLRRPGGLRPACGDSSSSPSPRRWPSPLCSSVWPWPPCCCGRATR